VLSRESRGSGGGEEAAPGLADGGAADKGRTPLRRDAEEDLVDEVVRQRRRRAAVARPGHGRPRHRCRRRCGELGIQVGRLLLVGLGL
jgi:hypothetical protein